MTHGERTRASDDPVESVARASEREEDFDSFLSRLDSWTTTDFLHDYLTAELAGRREETATPEPNANASAGVDARARESTRKVKRHRAAPPPPPPPRAPRRRVKGFHTVMLEIRETLIAPALATLETFQSQGLFTDDDARSVVAETERA